LDSIVGWVRVVLTPLTADEARNLVHEREAQGLTTFTAVNDGGLARLVAKELNVPNSPYSAFTGTVLREGDGAIIVRNVEGTVRYWLCVVEPFRAVEPAKE
jgi:hypothetical protein